MMNCIKNFLNNIQLHNIQGNKIARPNMGHAVLMQLLFDCILQFHKKCCQLDIIVFEIESVFYMKLVDSFEVYAASRKLQF